MQKGDTNPFHSASGAAPNTKSPRYQNRDFPFITHIEIVKKAVQVNLNFLPSSSYLFKNARDATAKMCEGKDVKEKIPPELPECQNAL
jgi:hypothetical protein